MIEDVNRNEWFEFGGSEESRMVICSEIVFEPQNGCAGWATAASWNEASVWEAGKWGKIGRRVRESKESHQRIWWMNNCINMFIKNLKMEKIHMQPNSGFVNWRLSIFREYICGGENSLQILLTKWVHDTQLLAFSCTFFTHDLKFIQIIQMINKSKPILVLDNSWIGQIGSW